LSEGGRRVVIAPAAQRQVRRLPPGDAARVRAPILALSIDAHPPGGARLTGTAFWRLRIGDVRVIHAIDDDETVIVLRVARRSERTYRRIDR
jgi:mRNA interferase RelE/StbE